ncbi:adenosylcobinamide amidohydrolase [Thermoplasma volcanium]|nr:adenosylcobinamide amidohydrolase [Thermoplasma volcanium]
MLISFDFLEENDYYMLKFHSEARKFSSAPFNGGVGRAKAYINRTVNLDYNEEVISETKEFLARNKIEENGTVCTLTAVDVNTHVVAKKYLDTNSLIVYITAGFDNTVSIGNVKGMHGTINIALLTDFPLSDAGVLNLFQTIVESKAQFMNDAHVTDRATGKVGPGTSTDTVSVFVFNDEKTINYAGRITAIGHEASLMVYNSLLKINENNKKAHEMA